MSDWKDEEFYPSDEHAEMVENVFVLFVFAGEWRYPMFTRHALPT